MHHKDISIAISSPKFLLKSFQSILCVMFEFTSKQHKAANVFSNY